jgi:hypothetical protein
MPRHCPLSAKILLWFVLNLALLGLLLYALLLAQFGFGQDWLLSTMANDRIDAVSESIFLELGQEPAVDWSAAIKRFDNTYQNHAHFRSAGRSGLATRRNTNSNCSACLLGKARTIRHPARRAIRAPNS